MKKIHVSGETLTVDSLTFSFSFNGPVKLTPEGIGIKILPSKKLVKN